MLWSNPLTKMGIIKLQSVFTLFFLQHRYDPSPKSYDPLYDQDSVSWLSVIPTANLVAIALQCLLATDFSSVEINLDLAVLSSDFKVFMVLVYTQRNKLRVSKYVFHLFNTVSYTFKF